MPRGAKPARVDPDDVSIVAVSTPGWLKNEIIDLAERLGCSMGDVILTAIWQAIRAEQGLVPLPEPRALPPTPADMVRAYFTGETLMMPCGKVGTCEGAGEEPATLGSMTFCRFCDVRLG
jgi:hypothetical protein